MTILAAQNRVFQGGCTLACNECAECRGVAHPRCVRPPRRTQRVGQFVIARVARQRLREIDPVAVEIDILVGYASQPRETMGIDSVDHQHRQPRGQTPGLTAAQPIHLRTRATKTFDAVGTRYRHQHPFGRARPEPGDVAMQFRAVRTPLRMLEVLERSTRPRRLVPKPGACRAVIRAEALAGIHAAERDIGASLHPEPVGAAFKNINMRSVRTG